MYSDKVAIRAAGRRQRVRGASHYAVNTNARGGGVVIILAECYMDMYMYRIITCQE